VQGAMDDLKAEVVTDMHTSFLCGALSREHGQGQTGAWGPLVEALYYEGIHVSEQELRNTLVHFYMNRRPEEVVQIIKRKMQDDLSFWRRALARDPQGAERYWSWYLLCLSVETSAFLSGVAHNSDPTLVDMPVDGVDFWVLAQRYSVKITVSGWMQVPRRFTPKTLLHAVHLLHNVQGEWLPLLQTLSHLEGFVVQCAQVSGRRVCASGQFALVEKCQGTLCEVMFSGAQAAVPLSRCNILRSIFSSANICKEDEDDDDDEALFKEYRRTPLRVKEDAAWEGIPDMSLEFFLLHHLVRRTAKECLGRIKNELAGRVVDPTKCCVMEPIPLIDATLRSSQAGTGVSRGSSSLLDSVRVAVPICASTGAQQFTSPDVQTNIPYQPQVSTAEPMRASTGRQQLTNPDIQTQLPYRLQISTDVPTSTSTCARQLSNPEVQTHLPRRPQMSTPQLEYISKDTFLEALKREPTWVWPSSEWTRKSPQELTVKLRDTICVREDAGNMWLWACTEKREFGYIPYRSVFTWIVRKEFRPNPDWSIASSCLTLNEGDKVIVESEYNGSWTGWAIGHNLKQPAQSGVFVLDGLKAVVQRCAP